ncbi:type II toxin-antitoxin system HicB family antitoxin [Alkalidesulfovibrio alkalitolerans]|jgi:predicted RNase H-like HicB family nuclease|nr:type II toxin-antitoxin system HicB family antitoxin [Alkalidesulfovibrio alkalitolerans]
MSRKFAVVMERDEDGFFVGSVPELACCHAQGATRQEMLDNLREVVALCLEVGGEMVACDASGVCLCDECGADL